MKQRLIVATINIIKRILISFGIILLIMVVLSFTSLPFWMYYNLGVSSKTINNSPDFIIVLGGGGIPSESGLMRTHKASIISKRYPEAIVIIALPGDTTNASSSIQLMKNELIERGTDSLRILLEPNGVNTRMQAMEIAKLIKLDSDILIITSPDHMFRSVLVFEKLGMNNTYGDAAFENAIESNLLFYDDKLGGNTLIPEVGNNTQLRYQFWNHFKYQIIVYREYMAIAYYKLKGWI